MKRIDLGSGFRPRPGFETQDLYYPGQVDHRFDLTVFPWPLESESFDVVRAAHVLEHLPPPRSGERDPWIRFNEEVWRILKPGGVFEASYPHPRGRGVWANPTHYRSVSWQQWVHLSDESSENYYSPIRWRILHHWVSDREPLFWGPQIRGVCVGEHLKVRIGLAGFRPTEETTRLLKPTKEYLSSI